MGKCGEFLKIHQKSKKARRFTAKGLKNQDFGFAESPQVNER